MGHVDLLSSHFLNDSFATAGATDVTWTIVSSQSTMLGSRVTEPGPRHLVYCNETV